MRLKNIYFIAFILFLLTDYTLRTSVNQFKYHTASYLWEWLPLALIACLITILGRKTIGEKSFGSVYFKLSFVSVLGLLAAKAIFFFQWYWITAPEYRNIDGDMEAGIYWTLLLTSISALQIMCSFLVTILVTKGVQKMRA